jgi:molybdopterin-guanine dinucleotide biosynthesis protein A
VSVTAIVLAGGRSSRFGSDKLAAQLDGGSVLAGTIRAIAPIADAVVVAGPAAGPTDGLGLGPARLDPAALATPGLDTEDPAVTFVADPEPFAGPLVALANALEHGMPHFGDVAIVVGGDMPRLVASVLVRMLDVLDVDPTVDAVYLGRPEAAIAVDPSAPSARQVLPLAIRVKPATRAARVAVEAGRRSLQALLDEVAAVELPSTAWLPLDPGASTLVDVDTQADLDRLR